MFVPGYSGGSAPHPALVKAGYGFPFNSRIFAGELPVFDIIEKEPFFYKRGNFTLNSMYLSTELFFC